MAYSKLSEQMHRLSNPQRSDAFVKLFRSAVREGKFDAIEVSGGRFQLPKQFKRQGQTGEHYAKGVGEMLFEATPAYEAWLIETDARLSRRRTRGSTVRVSLEAIESGTVDFQTLAAATRQRMETNFLKGQTLGKREQAKPKGRPRK
ncbi:hypothetical protein ACFFLM_00750 [Deinococcus oregonensis]|uniref:Uncharacterized protein n=1 Tax=Deinococcus oregonensis TaxID=1805970 RepID=A0ABV6AU42_9DEIO